MAGMVTRLSRGSSPLTRGKPKFKSTLNFAGLAHPRSRGENPFGGVGVAEREGSSPLTRGKQVAAVGGHGDEGLIPAHAGKTPRRRILR